MISWFISPGIPVARAPGRVVTMTDEHVASHKLVMALGCMLCMYVCMHVCGVCVCVCVCVCVLIYVRR